MKKKKKILFKSFKLRDFKGIQKFFQETSLEMTLSDFLMIMIRFMKHLESRNHSLMALAYVLSSNICFSLVGLSIKLAYNVPPFQIMSISSISTVVVTFLICQTLQINLYFDKKQAYKYLDWRCILGVCALGCGYIGMRLIPLTESAVLENLSPAWAGILCAIFLNEALSKKNCLLAISGFCGVILISKPEFVFGSGTKSDENKYIDPKLRFVGILAMIGMSIFKVLVGICIRKLDKIVKFNPVLMVFYFFTWSSFISSFACIFAGINSLSFLDGIIVIVSGIFYSCGHICYSRAFQIESVGKIMIMNQIKVLFNFLFDYCILGIVLDVYSIAGCVLITSSLIILTKS